MKATCRPQVHVGQREPTGPSADRWCWRTHPGDRRTWTITGGRRTRSSRTRGSQSRVWTEETRSLPRPLAGQRPRGSERERAGQRGAGQALARPSMAHRRVSSLATRAAVQGTEPGDERPQAAVHDCDPALGFRRRPSKSLHARNHF